MRRHHACKKIRLRILYMSKVYSIHKRTSRIKFQTKSIPKVHSKRQGTLCAKIQTKIIVDVKSTLHVSRHCAQEYKLNNNNNK